MAHFDQSTASCVVFTYKEGLLSAIAHDLQIRVERFEIDVDDAALSVHARFDARSLRVLGAMRDGRLDPGALREGDKEKIQHSIAEEVLHAAKHVEITYRSTSVRREGEGYRIEGELTLHGTTRPAPADARVEGDKLTAEVRLHQPDFGIKPFTAMLGTLKIKPDVTVRVEVPRVKIAP